MSDETKVRCRSLRVHKDNFVMRCSDIRHHEGDHTFQYWSWDRDFWQDFLWWITIIFSGEQFERYQ